MASCRRSVGFSPLRNTVMSAFSFHPLAEARVLNFNEYSDTESLPCRSCRSWSLTEESPTGRPNTSLKCVIKFCKDAVNGVSWNQRVSAHLRAGPDNCCTIKDILDLSVEYWCVCCSRASEHWSRKPLQSSALPEKGAGLEAGYISEGLDVAEALEWFSALSVGSISGCVGSMTVFWSSLLSGYTLGDQVSESKHSVYLQE